MPFPVMSRIAFGVKGAQVPAAVRGVVAIAWFGIQTYLASSVLSALAVTMFPGLRRIDGNSLLGQSTLGWITFLALWARRPPWKPSPTRRPARWRRTGRR
ncbi:hypothetical protein GCM10009863_29300 [Streptomyces axinellae]|uniref:Allantoin permease n=1 Tax=Streptomyces axinellae TaxID=552788 RepID=A0ABP6CFA5_9ACTN